MEKHKYPVSLFVPISVSKFVHKFETYKSYKLLNFCLGIFVFSLSSLVFADNVSNSIIIFPSTIKIEGKITENKLAENTSFSIGKTNTLLDDVGSAVSVVTSEDIESTPKTDISELMKTVPVVTKGPKPGGFVVPPSPQAEEYPGQYSFWDFATGKNRTTKPVQPYAPFALQTTPASDISFSYLDNPNHEKDFFDPLKRIHIGDDFLLSFGGQFWYRHVRETDRGLNPAGRNNSFHLTRLRLHTDIWYQDKIRFFGEFLDARALGESFTPRGIERNHTDMLSIFMDIKLAEAMGGKAYVRIGRQELTFGSQRLISSLDWANTRRTFQGVKTFWHTPKFNLDAFWVRPMRTQPNAFDQWQKKRDFVGLWGTYKPKKGDEIDLYFLSLLDNRNIFVGQGGVRGDAEIHTVGARYIGSYKRFLFELEGMYQFGDFSNQDISAGAVAVGGGYKVPLPYNPQFWLRYDYASGDDNLGVGGTRNTFNHLFPFGNYYMGWLDLVGRQNIHDFNAQFSLHPQRWLTLITQYHRYYLAEKTDFLYNAGGAGILRDATGASGSHVGDEIDVRFNIHVDRHQDVLVGYSKMWAGTFMRATRPGINPDLFYVQYNFRF